MRHKSNTSQLGPAVKIGDDFHGWLLDQASALKGRRALSLDWDNLAEELEAMAALDRRELLRRLTTLFEHMLKLQYQPDQLLRRSRRGWKLTIIRSRTEIRRLVDQSPGLKGKLEEFAKSAYADARRQAGEAMRMNRYQWKRTFPSDCPWSLDQVQDEDFFPSA